MLFYQLTDTILFELLAFITIYHMVRVDY